MSGGTSVLGLSITAGTAGATLPFTGFPVALMVLTAMLLIISGLLMVRAARIRRVGVTS